MSSTSVVTGVVGGRWRATITEWGGVQPWDGSPVVDWFVAADDRWHIPRLETSTRQVVVDGVPVVETRVRIPGGDAIQRVYSVADAGGLTIIEVNNDSSLPIAVAFTGGPLLSRRPATSVPPQGIDLPADAAIHPVGHHATVTVAIAHDGRADAGLPATVPSADEVARGWLAQTRRASRLHLPDASVVRAVTAARCHLLLDGPFGDDAPGTDPHDGDPAAVLLGIGELVRLGDRPSIWVPAIAEHLERWARAGFRIPDDDTVAAAIQASARVLHAAGEHTAVGDLRRMRLPASGTPGADRPLAAGRVPSFVERSLVRSDEQTAAVMPAGFPSEWRGTDFEAHGLPIGIASQLSFAIRWHGDRPAVLWEVSGPPMVLTHGPWTAGQLAGEALWPPITG